MHISREMGTDNCDANTKHFTSLPLPHTTTTNSSPWLRVMLVSSTCPGDLLELEGRSPSGDSLNSLSGRPTGAGGKESKWRPSQQPVRETYWSWREGVPVETVSTNWTGVWSWREEHLVFIQVYTEPLVINSAILAVLNLTRSLLEPDRPCTKSMEISESRSERVKVEWKLNIHTLSLNWKVYGDLTFKVWAQF